jgi:DNA repair protein RecN (Recombination protein N)
VLTELTVRDLGVIESVTLQLDQGMTALTGETGAGKTLLVEALELLVGGRADPALVRPGAVEALVEGRFVLSGGDGQDEQEVILSRAVPAQGRSRAWIDGRMTPVSALAEAGRKLVDLHGQHAHQSLLDTAAQRRALDAYAGVDLGPMLAARERCRRLADELASLGGDDRDRAREADLLRYQLAEIDGAALEEANEDDELAAEEQRLAEMSGHLQAAATAWRALNAGDDTDPAAVDLVGAARAVLEGRAPLRALAARLAAVQAEVADAASELREVVETWEEDPARLAHVRQRRQLLRELSRKYGDGPAGVLAYAGEARRRLDDLQSVEARAASLQDALGAARTELVAAEAAVGAARRDAAPALAKAVARHLRRLAMPHARLEVRVGTPDPGDDVSFLLAANPGGGLLPLSKVASGGELSRTMLALRLVLTDAPPTMVFDEVDAGVGGEAAHAVAQALAEVAQRHQVLVVTHLAQVAARAHRQHGVRKDVRAGKAVAHAAPLDGDDRVVELARMLSGRPDSTTARRHAEELLDPVAPPTRSARIR